MKKFFLLLAVKKSTCNSLIYFLMSIPNKRCWGRAKPLPSYAYLFSIRHQTKSTQKRTEAEFCNLESSKTTVWWVFAELVAAEIGPFSRASRVLGVRKPQPFYFSGTVPVLLNRAPGTAVREEPVCLNAVVCEFLMRCARL